MSIAVLIGLFLLALELVGVEGEPTRDLALEANVGVFTGGVSTAGLLAWGAVAGAAAMGGLMLWQRRREAALLLLTLAVGVGYLGFDDAFLLHEDVIRHHLGIEEQVTFLLLVAGAAAWALRFRVLILDSDLVLFGVVVLSGALGLIVDVLDVWSNAGEDWFKYVGLVALAGWVVDLALRQLAEDPELSALRRKRAPAGATPPPAR